MTPLPCPICQRSPVLRPFGPEYSVCCDFCFDGAVDAGPRARIQGLGITKDAAFSDWNEQVEEES